MAKVKTLKKGTRVRWTGGPPAPWANRGMVIADEEEGHVAVAVEMQPGTPAHEVYHMVIWCTVTWLTEEAQGEQTSDEKAP